ncbi:MAG TPA: bifunctional DNA-binding transcriptional regulator/O6-methylguanine-DNA methyltransferase Ada [Methyloceanibacter sp.]|jgi:AraC family transcriptional regulator of adaptative response/methylated-DNA-[protein]-cysteine methyltransferase|nr:bifunctional DNA-binding transcriptional regulator/O6-methylguanine-DNA methyltransferase Ada [Methyloceanibacter sp.]
MRHALANPPRPSVSAFNDDARWVAVVARDAAFDGLFYIAVSTTGIYCRPSCPARRPKREHVRFYDTAADAEAAGFRACKRCKPRQPSLVQQYAEKVAEACRLIETADEEPKLDALARSAGLSPYHFHRIFKSVLGVTPKAYATAHRNKRVREELGRNATVTQAIYGAGFNSNGRFYATSSEVLGMTPSQFRSGAPNSEIKFAIGDCSLGSVLVAASDKGVCAILFGDNAEDLTRDLKKQFPRARFIGDDPAFERLASKVVGFVEDPRMGLDLPLDIRGTAFQHRVWDALRRIPTGSTASYAEIAKAIGSPKSVRAVARACASNRIAVAIPCHRVIGSDGSLTGYRGGVERKRALLAKEAKS